jgi:hypothetical protein
MALKTKITETFAITASSGETYQVQEHTQVEVTRTGGVKREKVGRSYLKTEDGRGVLKNSDNNTYAIPSLGIEKATR